MGFESKMNIFRAFAAAAGFALALAGASAWAGDFSVNPIRLELGAAARSGVISIKNDSPEPLSFQLQAMTWTQDATGKDQYADTQALVFFPKIMTIAPGEEGLIRVGSKNAVVPSEKTYRLFIEEMPGATPKTAANGTQINVLIRFGAPVFITPLKPEDALDIERLDIRQGLLTLAVKNTGNRHQMVQGIALKGSDASGSEVYRLTLADRYLLTGTAKSYSTVIEAGQCAKIASLAVEFKTDRLSVTRQLDVTRAMCP